MDTEPDRSMTSHGLPQHRIVGIDHDACSVGQELAGPTQKFGDAFRLAVAIELVTEDVGQDEKLGTDLMYDRGEGPLIDLEDRLFCRLPGRYERRSDPLA